MGLSFYYIPRSQTPPLGVTTHLHTIQTATIWSLELENFKGIWKNLIESDKKTQQNIRETLATPRNGLSILSY